jgi:sulfur carrier protein ThiS
MRQITVTLQLAAILKGSQSGAPQQLTVPAGTTVAQLLKENLHYQQDELKHLVVVINDRRASLEDTIPDQAMVRVLLPTGGG